MSLPCHDALNYLPTGPHSLPMFGQPNHEGTECLYLRERGTSRILALTCRHVVLDEHQPNEDYLYDESDPASQLTMIQHADGTHRDMMALITSQKNDLKCSKTLLEKMTIPDDKKRKEMSVLDAKVTLLGQAEQTLASVEDHTSRIFGHVLFSPKLSNEVNGTYVVGVERLHDWALIELHADKHHVPPHKLENRVAVTPGDVEAITAAAKADGFESRVKLWVHSTRNNLQLGDTISETEVKKPPPEYESTSLGEPAIIVAKYGRTTGLTTSVTNEVVSVTRQLISDTLMTGVLSALRVKQMTGGFLFRDQAILGLTCGTLLAAGSENMSGRAFDSTYVALIILLSPMTSL